MSKPRNVWHIATKVDDVNYSPILLNKKVKAVLQDPNGWMSVDKSITFKFVEWDKLSTIKSKNKIPIRLSNNKTIVTMCGFKEMEKLSCCDMRTKEVWLNFYRWKNGAKPSKQPLDKYRNYMINHEVGHALGRLHASCPCDGCSAPIMMQHTITIGKCKPNDKPLRGE